MKSVLISIQPKWCELIASGKKTVEVRKTKPKLKPPFKVYIYCTSSNVHECLMQNESGVKLIGTCNYKTAIPCGGHIANGKVIGEFVCDKVTAIKSDAVYSKVFGGFDVRFNFDKYASCLTEEQISDYLGEGKGYAWYISDIVIYDRPKELGNFYHECKGVCVDTKKKIKCERIMVDGFSCNGCLPITRPPQSWCYVEEVQHG